MENKIEIIEGKQVLEIDGVSNVEEMKMYYKNYAKQFQDLVILDEQEKDYKEILKEMKGTRKPLKELRTRIRKELDEKKSFILSDFDEMVKYLDEAIKPLSEKLDTFAEDRKRAKIKKKKDKFMQSIIDINELIKTIDNPFLVIEEVEWNDKWNNTRDELINEEITKICNHIKEIVDTADDKIETAELIADKFKNEYDLKTKIDHMDLKENLYKTVSEVKEILENMAIKQQVKEAEIEEEIQARLKRKEEKERKEKEKEEKKKEKARLAEQERLLETEREKIRKEEIKKLEKEAKKSEKIEVGEKKLNAIDEIAGMITEEILKDDVAKKPKNVTVEDLFGKTVEEKTKNITLVLNEIKLSKAELLKEFLEENKIEYEIK